MEIKIDFNQNTLASSFYNANKAILNSSIINCLNMGDDAPFNGVTCRIPTAQYSDNNSIKALNFVVDEKTDDILKLTLATVEK
jgi:hypothetical protein